MESKRYAPKYLSGHLIVAGSELKRTILGAETFVQEQEGRVLFSVGYTAECSDVERPYFTLLAQGEPT